MTPHRSSITLFIVIASFLSSGTALSQSSSIQFEPLGQVSIPHNYQFKGTPVGGLSGLAYDPGSGTYYVISDDRSNLAEARFYSFCLELNMDGKLEKDGIRFENVHYLRTQQGNAYPEGEVDPEAIVFTSDSLIYISSEGVPGKNIPPFINAFTKTGSFVKEMKIPEAYRSADNSRGVRNNLGFEGLTASPDETRLFAATENALLQDGPAADSDNESPSRIIIYDLPADSVMHEFVYMVDRVQYESAQKDLFAVNGITALLALDSKGNLLVLERNYVAGEGNRIALYAASTEGATDIKGVAGLQQLDTPLKPVGKELVTYLNDFDIAIDNFEGLILGPRLENGGRLLLMVSDNNFSKTQQTLFTAFSIYGLK